MLHRRLASEKRKDHHLTEFCGVTHIAARDQVDRARDKQSQLDTMQVKLAALLSR